MAVSAELKKEMLAAVDTKAFMEVVKITAEIDTKPLPRNQLNKKQKQTINTKTRILQLIGHKTRLIREVEIPANDETMRSNIQELCRKYPQYAATISELRVEDFCEGVINKTTSKTLAWLFPRVYRKGAKTSKVLSKILNDYGFDVELSKVLQNNMIKGRAIVSIDPVDMVMLSTNTHKWGSCMSILYDSNDRTQNRGGFNKVGGFSLMRDGCTTVAYLDHNKTAVFSNE